MVNPVDIAERYLHILRLIAPGRWLKAQTDLDRAAALLVTGLPGDPDELVQSTLGKAEGFARLLPFWSGLKGNLRVPIGALLTTWHVDPAQTVALRKRARVLFREQGAGYADPYGFLAALLLEGNPRTGGLTPETVRLLGGVAGLLRRQHWFSYYHDVLPLLAVRPDKLTNTEDFLAEVCTITRSLTDAGFRSYAERLRAALLLVAHGGEDKAAIRAMQEWRRAMKAQGLASRMMSLPNLASLAIGWGHADRPGVDALVRLEGALRDGRPKADQRTALNQAAGLLVSAAPGSGRAEDGGGALRRLVFEAHIASLIAADSVAIHDDADE